MEILSIDDPDFVAKFKAAIGLRDGEELQFIRPQFDRTDGITPTAISPQTFGLLKTISSKQRLALGMQRWDDADENGECLWLFPAEWFGAIPKGFEVEVINGRREPFDPETSDDDRRFGVLAYGVRAPSCSMILGGEQ